MDVRMKAFVSNILGLRPQKISIKKEGQVSKHEVGITLCFYVGVGEMQGS
jgi:hypothetical protein